MRLVAMTAILACILAPTIAEEQTSEADIRQKLLDIELTSCLKAYEHVSAEIHKAEFEIATSTNDEMKSRFTDHMKELRRHRDEIQARAQKTARLIQASDQRHKQEQKSSRLLKCSCGQRVYGSAIERTASGQEIFDLYLRDRPRRTGRELDLAIVGPGYLPIVDQQSNKVAFTRVGNLNIDADGNLTVGQVPARYRLSPSIVIPTDATDIVVGKNGMVSVRTPGATELQEIGEIRLARFANPSGLIEIDENLFSGSETSGPAHYSIPGENGVGILNQKSIEVSDRARVRELVDALIYLLKKGQ